MDRNFIVPVAVENISFGAQISAAHGLNALKTKFFQVPTNEGFPDDPDIILPEQTANKLISTFVYDTVTFYGNNPDGSFSYFNFNTQSIVNVPKMQLPVAMCMVSKNIKVIKSEIAGRNGTIKQYINQGDYDVTIKGIFTTGVSDFFPQDALKQLNLITDCTTEVKVASNFLHIFGIKYLVFEKCEFEQEENEGRDVQKFTLNCVSETPFTIKVLTQGGTTSNGFGVANTSTPIA